MINTNTKTIFEALKLSEMLKLVVRYKESADDAERESVADHCWRMVFMLMVVTEELNLKIDELHAIKMVLVHDIIEVVTDDIDAVLVAEGKVLAEDKQRGEVEAIKYIETKIGGKAGKTIRALWEEFETAKTPEAKLVKALDRIEAMSHLSLVGLKNCNHADHIPNYADRAVKNVPELSGLLIELKKELKIEFEKNNIPWVNKYD
ncbi:MAG: HD domain-containing protein [Patescibacteria group bacterium]|jgi:5'-deoxynucleotidase YfbR-like HD superfamily hydrolase